MNNKRFLVCLLSVIFFVAFALYSISKDIRLIGGVAEDYKDTKGRVWHSGQKEKQDWGGWVKKLPQTAAASVNDLTAAAKKKADDAGYDHQLFGAVSWAANPATVKYDLKTGNGLFNVTYMVREHWSPNNRGYDIIIEGDIVEKLYVTPGKGEIDIKEYKKIDISDGSMEVELKGNAATKKGDLNPMFSALEVLGQSGTAVGSAGKLTAIWGTIKQEFR